MIKVNESNSYKDWLEDETGDKEKQYAKRITAIAFAVYGIAKSMERDRQLKDAITNILFAYGDNGEWSKSNRQYIDEYASKLNLSINYSNGINGKGYAPGVFNVGTHDESGFAISRMDNKSLFYYERNDLGDFEFTMEEAMDNGDESYEMGILEYLSEEDYGTPKDFLDCISEEYKNLKTYKSRVMKLYDFIFNNI